MAFKERVGFSISWKAQENIETIKLCLKTKRTAELDFGKQVAEFAKLRSKDRKEESNKIFAEVKEEMKKRFDGKEMHDLDIDIATGSFSVTPISESEYQTLLSEKKELTEKILGI